MIKKGFPSIHFYDQDFVDIYNKTWAWINDSWKKGNSKNGLQPKYFNYSGNSTIHQYQACLSTFFLVYNNRFFPAAPLLDNFYGKQEENGAIRGEYSCSSGKPVLHDDNPEGVHPPLFAWAEYNLFHKVGNKKRLREILPVLEKYFSWLEETFKQPNGLYSVPRPRG